MWIRAKELVSRTPSTLKPSTKLVFKVAGYIIDTHMDVPSLHIKDEDSIVCRIIGKNANKTGNTIYYFMHYHNMVGMHLNSISNRIIEGRGFIGSVDWVPSED